MAFWPITDTGSITGLAGDGRMNVDPAHEEPV